MSVLTRVRQIVRGLRKNDHPASLIVATTLMKTGLSRWFILQRDGYRLRFFDSTICCSMFIDRGVRQRDEQVFAQLLGKGDHVVDVGANIGHLTLQAKHLVGPRGRVYAFEVNPRTFRFLEANVALNRVEHVYLYPNAVSNTSGFASIDASRGDDQTFIREIGHRDGITTVLLDDVIPKDLPIKLLKIDTEGHELPVLQGARSTLGRVEYVFFECYRHLCERSGYSQLDLIRFLKDVDYSHFYTYKRAVPGFEVLDQQNLPAKVNVLAARHDVQRPMTTQRGPVYSSVVAQTAETPALH